LPRNTGTITLHRENWTLPAELPMGDATVVPLNSGEVIGWKLA
jgi:dihydroorotase